jgi:hypothetical protein
VDAEGGSPGAILAFPLPQPPPSTLCGAQIGQRDHSISTAIRRIGQLRPPCGATRRSGAPWPALAATWFVCVTAPGRPECGGGRRRRSAARRGGGDFAAGPCCGTTVAANPTHGAALVGLRSGTEERGAMVGHCGDVGGSRDGGPVDPCVEEGAAVGPHGARRRGAATGPCGGSAVAARWSVAQRQTPPSNKGRDVKYCSFLLKSNTIIGLVSYSKLPHLGSVS